MRSQIRRVLRQVRLAPASATALLLASCASVGPNFTRPAAPSTPGYLMSGDAQPFEPTLSPEAHPSGAWWRALGSAELDGVMTQALRDNQTLAAAEASAALADHGVVTPRQFHDEVVRQGRLRGLLDFRKRHVL